MADNTELKKAAISGFRWTVTIRLLAQIFQWTVTLVVIRLLNPEDYGLKAMAGVLFSVMTMIACGGIEQALIQRKELGDKLVCNAFGFLLTLSASVAVLQVVLGFYLADYYQEPILVTMLAVMAIAHLATPFYVIPYALMAREMEFKKRAMIELSASLVSNTVVFALALMDFAVWALVYGQLVNLIVRAILLSRVTGWVVPPQFQFKEILSLIKFGAVIVFVGAVGAMTWRMDVVIGAKIIGAVEFGFYAIALQLSMMPASKVMPLVNQIVLPVFSKLQDHADDRKWYFLKMLHFGSYASVLMFFLLSINAELLITLVLGDKWLACTVPLSLLALVIPLKVLDGLFYPLLTSAGRPAFVVRNLIVTGVGLAVGFYVGTQWGIVGLAVAWLACYPLILIVNAHMNAKALDMPLNKILISIFRPYLMAVVAVSGAYWVSHHLMADLHMIVTRLVVSIVFLMLFYLQAALLDRKGKEEFKAIVHQVVFARK